jgi:hypothetical protein
MLLQRPIKKSLAKLKNEEFIEDNKEKSSVFLRFNLFRNFSVQMQSEIEVKNSYASKFVDLISQNILMYRKNPKDLSLLEKIVHEPESEEFIAFCWSDCEFWRDASSLSIVIDDSTCVFVNDFHDFPTQVNEHGKLLMDLIIESDDVGNLFAFLIHDLKDRLDRDSNSTSDKNYFLKIKGDQFMKKSGTSLFSKIYSVISEDESKFDQCLLILSEILKEMTQVVDIRREVKIDKVLAMTGRAQTEIIKLILKFWKVNSKDYHYYRNTLCEISPFFQLYISLKVTNISIFH